MKGLLELCNPIVGHCIILSRRHAEDGKRTCWLQLPLHPIAGEPGALERLQRLLCVILQRAFAPKKNQAFRAALLSYLTPSRAWLLAVFVLSDKYAGPLGSAALEPVGRLGPLLRNAELGDGSGIPSAAFPSDHIPVGALFLLPEGCA